MKILIVDDHPLILEALQHVLQQLEGDVELYTAQTADSGRALATSHPDAGLLLLDLHLPGTHGLSLLAELRELAPTVPVVVLSASDRRDDILQAIDLGAMGFIPKRSTNQLMLQALRLVLSGGVYLPMEAFSSHEGQNQFASKAASETSYKGMNARHLGLTERQEQVLALMLQGKPNKVICRELELAEGTVKIHVAAILRAFNVSTRTQAVVEASRLGLHLNDMLPGLPSAHFKQ